MINRSSISSSSTSTSFCTKEVNFQFFSAAKQLIFLGPLLTISRSHINDNFLQFIRVIWMWNDIKNGIQRLISSFFHYSSILSPRLHIVQYPQEFRISYSHFLSKKIHLKY